jgi:hypothetical protein
MEAALQRVLVLQLQGHSVATGAASSAANL